MKVKPWTPESGRTKEATSETVRTTSQTVLETSHMMISVRNLVIFSEAGNSETISEVASPPPGQSSLVSREYKLYRYNDNAPNEMIASSAMKPGRTYERVTTRMRQAMKSCTGVEIRT